MLPTHSGSFRFFRFAGIQVYVHWSWFIMAVIAIELRKGAYRSLAWVAAEYLALFLIVLLHEFGHAFACRQTGGQADQIVLWPLGGIAYVNPPQRPGAVLWSIAAGPLVNVILLPVLFWLYELGRHQGWRGDSADLMRFLANVYIINRGLLIFNLLPVYPLDGGQIVRAVCWFFVGRAQSLRIAAGIGIVGSAIGLAYAIKERSMWYGIMAVFAAQRCLIGFREAKAISTLSEMPRHTGFSCPSCHQAPPGGPIWLCRQCRGRFDPFSTRAVCPHCHTAQATTACPNCGVDSPLVRWEEQGRTSGGFR
jgi:Zn-dependent protease